MLLTDTFDEVLTLAPALPFADPLSGLIVLGLLAIKLTAKLEAALDVMLAILPMPVTSLVLIFCVCALVTEFAIDWLSVLSNDSSHSFLVSPSVLIANAVPSIVLVLPSGLAIHSLPWL